METEVLNKKKVLIPKLRFLEFKETWKGNLLGEVADVRDGTHDSPFYVASGYPFVTSKNLTKGGVIDFTDISYISEVDYDNFNKRSKVNTNDILFGMIGTIGNPVLVKNDGFAIKNVALIKEKEVLQNIFLIHYLLGDNIIKQFYLENKGGTQKFLALKTIRNLNVSIPTLPEQQKIASFLSAVDEKIQQLTRKKELLEQYKKGVMQQLFSGKLRFKDENGKAFPKWEEKLLGEIAERNSAKNRSNNVNFVLTNSATQGVVSQDEYFDREIANQNNLEGYYIVSVNDFVYNPRISVHAPVGPIKRNKLKEGVMSPLYLIFRFKEKNLEYFEYYFETKGWHTYLESVSNIGARHDRMNIANSDFFKMPIPFPCLEERNKITNFLTGLSLKIQSTNNILVQTQTFKKGLLQQMFV